MTSEGTARRAAARSSNSAPVGPPAAAASSTAPRATPGRPVVGSASLGVVADLPVLDAAEQRVLGSLLEKEITVPASYPMSINSVRGACNQSSSREPVADYDEELVHRTLRGLKDKELVALTWQGAGSRVVKYVQTFAQRRGIAPDERALLTVLLLRGPQPAGALKTRTERLHRFADRNDVENCLTRMAGAEAPMVRELPRQPGQQDSRWIHLLGPVDAPEANAGSMPVDRESVLAAGPEVRDEKVRAAYAAVAESYAEQLSDELADLPFESWLLRRVVELSDGAPVIEVGTGPGHVAAFLAEAGATATGLDLTPEMVDQARRRHPGVSYQVGDLRQLVRPPTHDGWGAVLAWYSLIHLAASELPDAIASLARPLRANGWLVLALHTGADVRNVTDWFGHDVDLDFVLHDPAEMLAMVERAGLLDIEWYHRGPFASRGETTERMYVLARKP
ncbi:MAG: DUF480 domain-containing protein [Pseudonocardiales bacterium]|nr:MAG: DUF480 domain-containing protein [Pseudonocardiales bacterium]